MASSLLLLGAGAAAGLLAADCTPALNGALRGFVSALVAHVSAAAAHEHALPIVASAVVGIVLAVLVLQPSPGRVVPTNLKPRLPTEVRRVKTTDLTLPDRPGFIQCYNPATLQFLGEVPVNSPEQVKAVVAEARKAQAVWAKTTFAARRAVLESMKATIMALEDDIVRISVMDTGKPRVDAQFGEIMASCGKLQWVIDEGETVLAPESRTTNFTSMHKRAQVEYSPLGVVGVIAPWNYPFYNMFNHIASGLFAGNAVVIKISEYSAWSGSHFIRLAQDVLSAAGHDARLIQLVHGFGETGSALVNAADKIIFTGSPGVGKLVMRGASASLTPLVLELGGKDPFIVCDDVDIHAALPLAMRGSFQNAGQNCVGIERVYVYESSYDKFVAAAAAAVNALRVGPATDAAGSYTSVDVGCITTAPQLELIQKLVDDAVSKGARVLAGGFAVYGTKKDLSGTNIVPEARNGLFYAPTLLVDVTHEMRIANEEVFGPVMTVLKVPRDSDDAAVAMANATEYGLGATVFSNNPARANAIARRLHCGMVGINAYGLNYLVQSLPFGGVRASGFDRFSGPEGLRACCLLKSIVTDKLSMLSIPTPTPKPLQYPVAPSAASFTKALIRLQFGARLMDKVKAIAALAGLPVSQ